MQLRRSRAETSCMYHERSTRATSATRSSGGSSAAARSRRPDDDGDKAEPSASARRGRPVIERAAILAEGADFDEVMAWIVARGGKAEAMASAAPGRGLHASRLDDRAGGEDRTPLRFVLPPGALS